MNLINYVMSTKSIISNLLEECLSVKYTTLISCKLNNNYEVYFYRLIEIMVRTSEGF